MVWCIGDSTRLPSASATRQISPDEEKRATVLEGEICLFAALRTANKRGSNIPEATSKESVHKFVHALFWWSIGDSNP